MISKDEKYFVDQLYEHVSYVSNNLDTIMNALELPSVVEHTLRNEQLEHDDTKLEKSVYPYYIELSRLFRNNEIKNISEANDDILKAVYHHYKHTPHHPEYWDPEFTEQIALDLFHGKIKYVVNATEMPMEYIIIMCADWMAMSQARDNDVHEWADKNIGTRWNFKDDDIKIIYLILDILTGKVNSNE